MSDHTDAAALRERLEVAEATIRAEGMDNWLMLAALREAYTETHDLHHITSKSWDIDFAHCSLWVCRKNREKLLGWGCDVAALSSSQG